MAHQCEGMIKLSKKLAKEVGLEKPEDRCHAWASYVCEDCDKHFCHNHIDRSKHKCDDSVKGCHSIWKNGA